MTHPVVITFLVFAVIGFMGLAAEVLKPLALAVLLSFALAPLSRMFERWGLHRVPAVVLTVLLALGLLAGIGYKVGAQFSDLAKNLDEYKQNIVTKIERFKPLGSSTLNKLSKAGAEVAQSLDKPARFENVMNVNVVSQPSFTERLKTAVGPYLENLGIGSFVLILVLFMLVNREDLSDRIVRLFGESRVSLTTKTMEEVAQRISRYLMMFAVVNSTIGLVIGVGLSVIGVPLAVLWGVLAALLRFIPYVGAATAFILPLVFSCAVSPDPSWAKPMEVIALFAVVELVANSFLEPVIYGRTTGVSALGLLVAAMFWTWLWGGLGLLLSTPLTVCLAVLGKYVPGLRFFSVLLGEEARLEPDVRFYQRLLAMDQDDATQFIEEELKQRPRAEVFDQVLIPALSRCKRDRARDAIDDREQAFIWRVIGDLLEELAETPEVDLKTLAPAAHDAPMVPESVRILGIAASDHNDVLALRMLEVLLAPSGCRLSILEHFETPLQLAEEIAEYDPQLVIVSHVPPSGSTVTRYLVRRLRARFQTLPLLVGHWGASGNSEEIAATLTALGATLAVFRLAEARSRILDRLLPRVEPEEPTKELVAPASTGANT
jgi:predicted PurR-regulated permease PerM